MSLDEIWKEIDNLQIESDKLHAKLEALPVVLTRSHSNSYVSLNGKSLLPILLSPEQKLEMRKLKADMLQKIESMQERDQKDKLFSKEDDDVMEDSALNEAYRKSSHELLLLAEKDKTLTEKKEQEKDDWKIEEDQEIQGDEAVGVNLNRTFNCDDFARTQQQLIDEEVDENDSGGEGMIDEEAEVKELNNNKALHNASGADDEQDKVASIEDIAVAPVEVEVASHDDEKQADNVDNEEKEEKQDDEVISEGDSESAKKQSIRNQTNEEAKEDVVPLLVSKNKETQDNGKNNDDDDSTLLSAASDCNCNIDRKDWHDHVDHRLMLDKNKSAQKIEADEIKLTNQCQGPDNDCSLLFGLDSDSQSASSSIDAFTPNNDALPATCPAACNNQHTEDIWRSPYDPCHIPRSHFFSDELSFSWSESAEDPPIPDSLFFSKAKPVVSPEGQDLELADPSSSISSHCCSNNNGNTRKTEDDGSARKSSAELSYRELIARNDHQLANWKQNQLRNLVGLLDTTEEKEDSGSVQPQPSSGAVKTMTLMRKKESAWVKLSALVKGHLTRKLLHSRACTLIMQCICDSSQALVSLQQDANDDDNDNVLVVRLYAQVRSALLDFHDVFFKTSVKEKMQLIRNTQEIELKENVSPRDSVPKLSKATQKSMERKKRAQSEVNGSPAESTVFTSASVNFSKEAKSKISHIWKTKKSSQLPKRSKPKTTTSNSNKKNNSSTANIYKNTLKTRKANLNH